LRAGLRRKEGDFQEISFHGPEGPFFHRAQPGAAVPQGYGYAGFHLATRSSRRGPGLCHKCIVARAYESEKESFLKKHTAEGGCAT